MHKVAEFANKSLDIRCATSDLILIVFRILAGCDQKHGCSCNCLDETAACCLGQGLASVTTLTSLDLRS
jgi:hypothetical protein